MAYSSQVIQKVIVLSPNQYVDSLKLKPLSHKTMKSTRLYTKLLFFTPCRLRGGLCRLRDKTGTLPETLCSLRDKPCSLRVRAEIFWLLKNFHELHMMFDLEIHRVNFMLTSCTLRGIVVHCWLTSCYFAFTSYPNFKHEVNVKSSRCTMTGSIAKPTRNLPVDHVTTYILVLTLTLASRCPLVVFWMSSC